MQHPVSGVARGAGSPPKPDIHARGGQGRGLSRPDFHARRYKPYSTEDERSTPHSRLKRFMGYTDKR